MSAVSARFEFKHNLEQKQEMEEAVKEEAPVLKVVVLLCCASLVVSLTFHTTAPYRIEELSDRDCRISADLG